MKIVNYVGIDMAKASFCACFAEGEQAKEWNNSKVGINQFFRYLTQCNYGKGNTVLGVESTGRYHYPLCIACQQAGYAIKVINPLITKKQNLTTLRRIKNDKKDAVLIRYCLIQGNGYEYQETEEQFILKTLVRQRNAISSTKNRVRKQMADIEYKEQAVNQKINSIYVDLYDLLVQKQQELEKELSKYGASTQKLLQSIPGVGPITAASFVAEIIDVRRFKHPKHLVAYCGIDPRVYESGTSIKGKGYITKRGSKILRTILYNAASVAVQRENMFQEFFQKKIAEGKPYRVALVATMRKMVHVIYAVWNRETPFENQIPTQK